MESIIYLFEKGDLLDQPLQMKILPGKKGENFAKNLADPTR